MSKTLIYYKPSELARKASAAYPGTERLAAYLKMYNAGAVPIDRTGIISSALRINPLFPIPQMRPFRASFEDICNERAAALVSLAEKLDARICVLWSGGIDSTLALISLLKNSTEVQRKRFTVLMSQLSIAENPAFYDSHIRAKLRADTSRTLPKILGTKTILVTGEHNDQLFGSDIMAPLIRRHGPSVIHRPYDRRILHEHFMLALNDEGLADFYLDLFERLVLHAIVPIQTLFEFVWWINFSLKWQTVYARALTFVAPQNAAGITPEYVRDYYAHFYNTEDFQLWSLNNLDKRIKDTWESYKWPCKDIIYDFTKDAHYRNTKIKVGSLASFMLSHKSYKAIDTDLKQYNELDLDGFYNSENDFADAAVRR